MSYAEVLAGVGFTRDEIKAMEKAGIARKVRVCWSWATGVYLLLNALSTKVPGPAWYLGLAPHVRLFAHIELLMRAIRI